MNEERSSGVRFRLRGRDGIATVTLNRPDVLNALTFDIYGQLRDLMAALRTDDEVRVVVVTGEGKGFCSGGDVHDIIGPLFEMDVKDTSSSPA